MAESMILKLTKNVELNRRRLIENCRSKNKNVDYNASLDEVVTVNNSIDYSDIQVVLHEIRFFDVDGTLLKRELVEDGGSCTPPEKPNLDPENLTFDSWVSAIGERFDNITHDVDYGAYYTINDKAFHLFCEFTEDTGLEDPPSAPSFN